MTRSESRTEDTSGLVTTTTTFCPAWASAAPSAAVEVVLPTPPLPDVTTRTLAIVGSPSVQHCHADGLALEPGLDGPADEGGLDLVGGPERAVYPQEFGFKALVRDAGAR